MIDITEEVVLVLVIVFFGLISYFGGKFVAYVRHTQGCALTPFVSMHVATIAAACASVCPQLCNSMWSKVLNRAMGRQVVPECDAVDSDDGEGDSRLGFEEDGEESCVGSEASTLPHSRVGSCIGSRVGSRVGGRDYEEEGGEGGGEEEEEEEAGAGAERDERDESDEEGKVDAWGLVCGASVPQDASAREALGGYEKEYDEDQAAAAMTAEWMRGAQAAAIAAEWRAATKNVLEDAAKVGLMSIDCHSSPFIAVHRQ